MWRFLEGLTGSPFSQGPHDILEGRRGARVSRSGSECQALWASLSCAAPVAGSDKLRPTQNSWQHLGDARGGSYEGLSRAEAGESPLWQTLPTTAPFLCASDHTGFPYWNHLIPPASQILGYPQSPDQKGLLWAKCSAYTFLFNPLCCLTYKTGIEIPTANIIYPPICRWGKWGSEG